MATAMSIKDAPKELMSCPYNKAHQIIQSRMQTHLAKCKKNYADKDYLECPYNSVHKVPGPEYMHHVETCKDREKLDTFIYCTDTCDTNKFPLPNIEVQPKENWDDVNEPSYNPVENCIAKPILRNKNLLPAAQRRSFRIEERHRHQQLENGKVHKIKAVKENAVEYAKRQSKVKVTEEHIDENDPFSVTPLTQRIAKGGIDIREVDEHFQTSALPKTEVKKEEAWCKVPKQSRGRGRGFLLKTTN